MATSLKYPTYTNAVQKTLDEDLYAGTTSFLTLNNVTGIQNKVGVCVIDRVDGNGDATPLKREYIIYSGVSGKTLTGLTRNADGGSTDQDHLKDAIVEFVSDVLQQQAILDALGNLVNIGTGEVDTTKIVDLTTSQTLASKILTSPTVNVSISGTAIDDDGALTANSSTKLATQKATKTYADTKMAMNATITGATKTKITYDYKGLVTSGTDATTADIADSTNKRYVSDAQLVIIGNTSNTNTGDETQATIKTKLGAATASVDGYATSTQITKLDGIAAGAEVNVNADWNASSGDAQILNKPSIPTQYTDEMAQDAVGNAVGNGLDYDDTTGAIAVDETELAHNSLGSKDGGTTNEYYHLTSAQHTITTRAANSTLAGYMSSTYASKLEGMATGSTANAKISGSTLDSGADDTGFVTAAAINASHNVPLVAPSTLGNLMTSNGTDWISSAPPVSVSVTTKGDIQTYSTVPDRLPVGTNGYVLSANASTSTGLEWISAPSGGSVATDAIWDAKGDLVVGTGANTAVRLPVGTNGYVLAANASVSSGVEWVTNNADTLDGQHGTYYENLAKNSPRGHIINGRIVPSVASNNLTVALKGIDGNDPSASNPVYIRIGDTVRSITSALSVTKNAGTNWFNSGSASLATKEVDYFVYLGYNATDGVVIGFSPFPNGYEYSDFSTTNTNQKYCAISTITNAAAGDDYELIGRFAATLSAGAGYTWTVPTFTNINLIQFPIRETRQLDFAVLLPGDGTMTTTSITPIEAFYQIFGNVCRVHFGRIQFTVGGTPTAIVIATLPKTAVAANTCWAGASAYTNSAYKGAEFTESTTTSVQIRLYDGGNWTAGSSYFGGELSFKLG